MLTAEERYTQTLFIAQNRAMEVLAELLEQAADPIERRRIATVIMRAIRPKPVTPKAPAKSPPAAPTPHESTSSSADGEVKQTALAYPPISADPDDVHPFTHTLGRDLMLAHRELERTVEEAKRRQSSS